uniref:Uncharacterized protein n=1 Tax=Setaria italica TaxID=4555 RepID=K3ZYH4_SETIT
MLFALPDETTRIRGSEADVLETTSGAWSSSGKLSCIEGGNVFPGTTEQEQGKKGEAPYLLTYKWGPHASRSTSASCQLSAPAWQNPPAVPP